MTGCNQIYCQRTSRTCIIWILSWPRNYLTYFNLTRIRLRIKYLVFRWSVQEPWARSPRALRVKRVRWLWFYHILLFKYDDDDVNRLTTLRAWCSEVSRGLQDEKFHNPEMRFVRIHFKHNITYYGFETFYVFGHRAIMIQWFVLLCAFYRYITFDRTSSSYMILYDYTCTRMMCALKFYDSS